MFALIMPLTHVCFNYATNTCLEMVFILHSSVGWLNFKLHMSLQQENSQTDSTEPCFSLLFIKVKYLSQ